MLVVDGGWGVEGGVEIALAAQYVSVWPQRTVGNVVYESTNALE